MTTKWISLVVAIMFAAGCVDKDSPRSEAIGTTEAKIALLCQALGMNYVDRLSFPESQAQFEEQLANPNTGYLRQFMLTDGWKQPMRYSRQSEFSATIWSSGENPAEPAISISCALTVDRKDNTIAEVRYNKFSNKTLRTLRPFLDYTGN